MRLLCCLLLAAAACATGAPESPASAPQPVRPLSALATQQVIVTPVNSLRETDPLGWTQQIPRARQFLRAFDDSLEAELRARGLAGWVYPAALVRASRGSPAYAVDPYTISAAPLRAEKIELDTRLADPLASQLRTMIALQESARVILVPVEIRFDRLPDGRGIPMLRLALVDGRTTEVRWIGDVPGTPATTFSPDLVSSLVAHTADLIAAR